MFNFIKKLFARLTRPETPKKQIQQPITSFGGGAGHQSIIKAESVETSKEFLKRAREEYVKKAKCFK